MTALAVALPDVARITYRDGKPRLDFSGFHAGQRTAYHSDARFTLVLAGTQGGKTAVGPAWLMRQMRKRGAGDYMVVSPTFTLMWKKCLPEFLRLFQDTMRVGELKTSPVLAFRVTPYGEERLFGARQPAPTTIFFGYGAKPESLESATIKACWIDEGGQPEFKRESWDAILRRLSIEQGPVLLTTTPYTLGWLSELHRKADDPHSGVRIVNFPSIANPTFPRSEWDRAKRTLPEWKFRMFYMGLFERPAGMIYDCWDRGENTVEPFAIPESWPRYLGLDFGGVNTAGIFLAEERGDDGKPTGRYFEYREYHAGGRTAEQHKVALLAGEPRIPRVFGGSKSEGQWRQEFAAAGLPIEAPPVSEVEVGINRVYGAIKERKLITLRSLQGIVDQTLAYSRVLDERGEPTEAIADKDTYHLLDARRYVVSGIIGGITPQIWV
jgi:hypothetical protein